MSWRHVRHSVWDNPGNRGRRIRKMLGAVGWQLQKRLAGTPRILRLASGAKFRAHPNCVISSALIYADWPEYAEVEFIRHQLRRGDVILDIGANVGSMGLLLSDLIEPTAIFEFEPTPFTFRRLCENWRLNGWPEENLFCVALGAAEGTAAMPDVDHPDSKNSLLAAADGTARVQVPVKRLDDFRHCWVGKRVGFVKIDVEGYEREVLAGAKSVLVEDRPRLVMFESLGHGLDPEIGESFAAARYAVFQLDDAGRPEMKRLDAQNLFAVPVEFAPEMGLA